MRDLRLIGVHDDGEHLVVTDDAGEEFRLRIDEQLRAAARRDRPRLGQLQIAIDNDVRPREVQAMIRSGATAEEVAARTGWDPDKVARFEGPVLAEREHIAGRAQTVRMRGTNQAGAPETLSQRAATRLNGRGVDPASVGWDSCRDADGQWTVSAVFTAGGRERTATWWFDHAGMSVVAKNDEAKWLSEADAPAGPVPAAVHRPTAVFDVEVEQTKAERATRANTDELIASMREHSGAKSRRRGGGRRRTPDAEATSQATEDALPLETEDELPPAAQGPHPKDVAAEEGKDTSAKTGKAKRDVPKTGKGETDVAKTGTSKPGPKPTAGEATDAPQPEAAAPDQPTPSEATPVAAATDKAVGDPPPKDTSAKDEPVQDEPIQDEGSPTADGDSTDVEQDSDQARDDETKDKDTGDDSTDTTSKGRGRKGRASVPSWDDVMFGTRRD